MFDHLMHDPTTRYVAAALVLLVMAGGCYLIRREVRARRRLAELFGVQRDLQPLREAHGRIAARAAAAGRPIIPRDPTARPRDDSGLYSLPSSTPVPGATGLFETVLTESPSAPVEGHGGHFGGGGASGGWDAPSSGGDYGSSSCDTGGSSGGGDCGGSSGGDP